MDIINGILEFLGACVVLVVVAGAFLLSVAGGDSGESVDIDAPHESSFGNATSDYRVTEFSEVKAGDEVFHPRNFDHSSGKSRW